MGGRPRAGNAPSAASPAAGSGVEGDMAVLSPGQAFMVRKAAMVTMDGYPGIHGQSRGGVAPTLAQATSIKSVELFKAAPSQERQEFLRRKREWDDWRPGKSSPSSWQLGT